MSEEKVKCSKCLWFQCLEIEENCKFYIPITNGDRIRRMSDEELAQFFWKNDKLYMNTPQETVEWLKEEAEI